MATGPVQQNNRPRRCPGCGERAVLRPYTADDTEMCIYCCDKDRATARKKVLAEREEIKRRGLEKVERD